MTRFTALPALMFLSIATGSAGESFSIPVDPAQERLVVALWQGDIVILPGASDEIIVTADCAAVDMPQDAQSGSFRSLTSSTVLPDVVTGDDVISIRAGEQRPPCSLSITAAARLDLFLRIDRSGSIRVNDWTNHVQAWSAEGDVILLAQRGSHSVTAMNGDATVSLAAPPPANSAISAANGTLTLTVEESALPALRAQARWGEVLTNLSIEFEEVVEAGGRWFVAARDETGPMLTLRNLNRDIVIRRAE